MTRRLTRTGVIHILPTTCSLTDTAKTVRTNLRVLFSSPNLSYLAHFFGKYIKARLHTVCDIAFLIKGAFTLFI
jgi:hypothetical protein